MVPFAAPACLRSASHISRATATWLDAVVKPTIAEPSTARVISMKAPSAGPAAVVLPPIRISVPVASRSRRVLRFCVSPAGLISDPHARGMRRQRAECFHGCRVHVRRLQLAEGEGGEGGRHLRIDRRLVVQPASLDDGVELLDHDSSAVDGGAGMGDFLVLSRHVVVGGKYRYAAAGIARHV